MSYQALLFCPDEKTARIVSQVLTELEFTVDPCHEPFAAVKKLMVQHFDAIVVDCDNEQNAGLLFKSARNSGSNQASLAVAVVEGQAGVAKAFRLGANLVLTKPIHVEQSKGTLRVARGLLRKGQAAKAVDPASGFPESTVVAPKLTPAPFPPPQPMATARPASASAFELDAEPMPQPDAAEAALLEYMPDTAMSDAENSARSAAETDPSKQFAWQPRKPLAEPMASALRRAAEAAGKTEFDAGAPATRTGAASAPARAKEIPAPIVKNPGLEPTASAISVRSSEATEIIRIEDPSAGEGWNSGAPSAAAREPSFASLEDSQQAPGAGGSKSKKGLLIVVLVLGLAAAAYFGWSKMQSTQPQPATPLPASTGTAATSGQTAFSTPEAQPASGQIGGEPEPDLNGTAVVTPSKPSAAIVADGNGVKTPAGKPAPGADDVTAGKTPAAAKAEPAPVLVVQNGGSTQAKTEPEVQEPEQAPAVTSIASDSNSSSALSGLVNTNAINARKAPQQTLRISQGVSQGLILKKVQPLYPEQARQMHLEGTVELQANISKSGSISAIKQLSGDPILGRSAADAVRQWKYKPYFLNGEPIEIQTQITVIFKLP
ncbi:MAG: TonB family protein [Terriglobales bacterium]